MSDDLDQEPVTLEEESWARLKGALSDTSSGRRRDELLAADGRTTDEIGEAYQALDRALEILSERVDQTVVTAPIARVVEERHAAGASKTNLSDEERAVLAERCDLLYEDIVWLFAVNDGEGALISLERMLMLGEPQGDAKEFVEALRLETLVKRYSDYVMHPITIHELAGDADSEPRQLNQASALWAKQSKDVTDEDYAEFYKHVMGGFVLPGDEPTARLHISLDAPIQFQALLFVPGRAPADEVRRAVVLDVHGVGG